jgi:hypothetical protein
MRNHGETRAASSALNKDMVPAMANRTRSSGHFETLDVVFICSPSFIIPPRVSSSETNLFYWWRKGAGRNTFLPPEVPRDGRTKDETTECARRDSNSQPSDPKSFSVTLKPWIPCPIPKMTRRTPVSNFVECCDQYGPRLKLEPSAFLNSTRSRHSTCRSCGYDNPSLDTLRGMFVAQSIEPQARTLAESRDFVCFEVD